LAGPQDRGDGRDLLIADERRDEGNVKRNLDHICAAALLAFFTHRQRGDARELGGSDAKVARNFADDLRFMTDPGIP
jgi:hypothetical protein